MTDTIFLCLFLSVVIAGGWAGASEVDGPTRAEVEAMMGLPSEGDRVRGQMEAATAVS